MHSPVEGSTSFQPNGSMNSNIRSSQLIPKCLGQTRALTFDRKSRFPFLVKIAFQHFGSKSRFEILPKQFRIVQNRYPGSGKRSFQGMTKQPRKFCGRFVRPHPADGERDGGAMLPARRQYESLIIRLPRSPPLPQEPSPTHRT